MDPLLLQYYNEELIYMRQAAAEFAAQHPKIAQRLGLQGINVADPFVERLIEGFSFMSARTRIKLDASYPVFTQRLLEVLYPNYTSPTPSISVAQLHPSTKEGDFRKGYLVPKGSALHAKIPDGEKTACEFRTGQDLSLWPLVVTQAKLAGLPPDIPLLDRYLPAHVKPVSSLRLRLSLVGEGKISDITGLESLPIYLCGEESVASHLFELIHTSSAVSFIGEPQKMGENPSCVTQNAVSYSGLAPHESLLPIPWNSLHGHNLLHEYFACPSRFFFFQVNGLANALKRINGREVEIVIILTRPAGSLSTLVDEKQFALHCVPIINLFERRTDRLEVDFKQPELHLVPDRSAPTDFEVFNVSSLVGHKASSTATVQFRPLYQTLNQDEGNHGAYFSLRRELRKDSDSIRKYGTRTDYTGSEVFVSLVNQKEAPYDGDIRYLSVTALLTNRDLPRLVPRNGYNDLKLSSSAPITAAGFVRPPSPPLPMFAVRENAWRLIRQIGFNHLPLADISHREGAQGLRDMLRLFVRDEDEVMNKQILALIGSQIKPTIQRLPGSGPLIYGRGVECTLTVDEDGFSGMSPYLFGLILEQYLAKHVSINTFTQTKLISMQRGDIMTWPVRMGTRDIV